MQQRIFILFLVLFSTAVCAQEKPVVSPPKPTPVEFLFGHNRLQGQTTIIKNFPQSKFGFFSLSTLAGDYSNTDKTNNELFSNVQLSYDVFKGIRVTMGGTFSSFKGFSPIAGLEYVYANKKFVLVANPTIDLKKQPTLANYAHLEYTPKDKKFNLYGRLQGLYVHNVAASTHERSAAVIRLGVSHKGFSTGLGLNQDYYDPAKNVKSNVGIFFQYKFM
ncbi:hypothetical protein [Runella sp. SP2]|uniref:hypothetical protein n=1 Tax=Runella sp. SP2 TaxID=2268026 RepID=UPI000F0877F8|nr:hypothetical protein [Runella sp. SP2]AYQ32118.1 hypothetical protein DTQ70_07985 [Runella sp. SP2]